MVMTTVTVATCGPKRIGIVGHYGVGNLGDDTVVAILIKRIRERYPNVELSGFSLRPADTEWRHGIKAFSMVRPNEVFSPGGEPPLARTKLKPTLSVKLKQLLKKCPILFKPLKGLKIGLREVPGELSFWRRSFHRLRGCDLLVVPGSGPLTDWWGRGPWEHPYSFLGWFFLARITGTKVIALSIGSERLKRRLSKSFCKWALSMAQYRSFRDRYSRDTMEALGLKGDNPVFPDQGFAVLDVVDSNQKQSTPTESKQPSAGLTVGVTPIDKRSCVAEGDDDGWYDRYTENLSAFLCWLVQTGYRIAFCPTDTNDQSYVQDIVEKMTSACPRGDLADRIIKDPIPTTEALIARIQLCDLMIASRFHGVVLPFALHKPVLAISSYGRKMRDLMSQCGQDDFHLPMKEADPEQMKRAFQALEQNRHAIARHLESVVADFKASLERQYEDVFGPLDQGRRVAPR
jgi:polysaccharide pyruvyl transferase WcaK-like protein